MNTSVTYSSAQSEAIDKTIYTRFADVRRSDNGLVTFKLGATGTPFTAYASNQYGGGWILLAQFVHRGGTNPAITTINAHNNLPVLSTAPLGTDESTIPTQWGTISATFLNLFPDATTDLELWFYGQTNAHARVISFITDAIIDRWRTNTGTMLDVRDRYILLPEHTAFLPRATDSSYQQQNVTNFPFYNAGDYHWGIRGLNTRWEVDDFTNNDSRHTIHRVWCRYKPGVTQPLVVNGDFLQGNVGWILAGNVVVTGGQAVFSGGDTPITGVLSQVCATEAGCEYNLRYNVGFVGAGPGMPRLLVEIRDDATNALIVPAQLSVGQPAATYNVRFTARGQTRLVFIDNTTNTTNKDCTLDNVSLSRYIQG